jgi:RND family efflux transporter MFP subunit
MKKWVVIVLVIAAGVTLGMLKFKGWKTKGSDSANGQRLSLATVTITNISFSVNSAGDIGPADQVSVRPEINGKIDVLAVDIGDKAAKGSMLFTLDDKDLQSERDSNVTEIEGANLQVERCRRNYERSIQLFKDKLISLEVYENTKTEFELAKNTLERAKKALNMVEDKLTKTKILAPFDCTVLTRPVSVGQAVSGSGGYNSGTEVLTIANLNEMIVNAHINQADVTRLKMDQEVDMEVEAVPGLKMKGKIQRIAPQATVRNGIKGFATRILLTNIDPRVRPGMTANLSIPVANAANVMTVPLAAVFTEMGERYCWLVKDNGNGESQYEKRPVTIGVADYANVEIQTGLKSGEQVSLEQPPAKVLENLAKEVKPIAAAPASGITNTSAIAKGEILPVSRTNLMAATTNRVAVGNKP